MFESEKLEKLSLNEPSLTCLVCKHDEFIVGEGRLELSTGGSNTLGLESAVKTTKCFVCENCGFIHHFIAR